MNQRNPLPLVAGDKATRDAVACRLFEVQALMTAIADQCEAGAATNEEERDAALSVCARLARMAEREIEGLMAVLHGRGVVAELNPKRQAA